MLNENNLSVVYIDYIDRVYNLFNRAICGWMLCSHVYYIFLYDIILCVYIQKQFHKIVSIEQAVCAFFACIRAYVSRDSWIMIERSFYQRFTIPYCFPNRETLICNNTGKRAFSLRFEEIEKGWLTNSKRENKIWKWKCAAFAASQLEDSSACVYYRWLESPTLQYRLFWKLNTHLLGRTRYSYYFRDNWFTFVLPYRSFHIGKCGNLSTSVRFSIDRTINRRRNKSRFIREL